MALLCGKLQYNFYNCNLASYLVRILQPISTNQFTMKDSFSFADWAKAYKHHNEMMCSFDVSSQFTNVPLDDTIQICLDKLYALPNPATLPRLVLKVTLEFATKKSHFILLKYQWCSEQAAKQTEESNHHSPQKGNNLSSTLFRVTKQNCYQTAEDLH